MIDLFLVVHRATDTPISWPTGGIAYFPTMYDAEKHRDLIGGLELYFVQSVRGRQKDTWPSKAIKKKGSP